MAQWKNYDTHIKKKTEGNFSLKRYLKKFYDFVEIGHLGDETQLDREDFLAGKSFRGKLNKPCAQA